MGNSQPWSQSCFIQRKISGRLNTEQALRFSRVAYCVPPYDICLFILIMPKKDPAFLFYPGIWLKGTQLMSRSHKGAYMDILVAQFSNKRLSIEDIKTILGSDYEIMWDSKLKFKFSIDANGLYYNEFMESVIANRNAYKNGRMKNLKGKKEPHMETPYGKPHEEACGNSYGNPICKDKDKDKDKDINKDKDSVWKKDFSTYKSYELENYKKLIKDIKFISELTNMLPVVDVLATMEKSHREYWSQEDGWKNKKSKRIKNIDWKSTYRNACKMEFNQIKKGIKPKSPYKLLPPGEY